jgi:hypothetical protein
MEPSMNRLALGLTTVMLAAGSTAGAPEKVAFPSGYRSHVSYLTVDRPFNATVRVFYASPEAAKTARSGQPLPRGTVITMEVYKAKVNEQNQPVKDAAGRFIKADLVAVMVMEKRRGWGAEYPKEIRNGEWEYAEFSPDGTPHEPADAKPCLECHKRMSTQDFVFSFPALAAESSRSR